ncbi:hypothetical protein ZOSMA_5G00150 [Zostera marina]|uniref:Uncharacterized protein n=1 Tax=Zostera marina TaxID=29655 RepID=A0A0K9NTR6_ZOSMR|nr:hypothetical protein ZOSMA_5G00150 [Zostera marina]
MSTNILFFQKRSKIALEEPILCRIPNDIKGNRQKEYEPKILAIGPYHRSIGGQRERIHPRLKPIEDMKLQFLVDLCKREAKNRNITKEDVLQTLITDVQSQELNARKKYSSEMTFEMSSENFLHMLVLDGCFILELMLKIVNKEFFQAMPKTFTPNTCMALKFDMLLFENQIPFFILEKIFGSCSSSLSEHNTLLDLALSSFYQNKMTLQMLPNEYWMGEKPEKIHHLLHLSHICLVGRLSKEPENHVNETLLRNLFTKKHPECHLRSPMQHGLREYGIKFRMKKIRGSDTFLDVSFKDEIMEIPYLRIEDSTTSKFRNLLALEQSCKKYGNKLTRYISFMDDLIDKDSDVALLMNKNIIGNYLGSTEKLANMFIEMCDGLSLDQDNHYLKEMYEKINKYCDRPVNKWWAKLTHHYFNSPWSIISLFGVSVLLILAIVQTLYSVKSFNIGN